MPDTGTLDLAALIHSHMLTLAEAAYREGWKEGNLREGHRGELDIDWHRSKARAGLKGENTMTPTDTSAIRARLDAASDGPWLNGYPMSQGNATVMYGPESKKDSLGYWHGPVVAICPRGHGHVSTADNQNFMSNAPTDIAALLAENKNWERAWDWMREFILHDGICSVPFDNDHVNTVLGVIDHYDPRPAPTTQEPSHE